MWTLIRKSSEEPTKCRGSSNEKGNFRAHNQAWSAGLLCFKSILPSRQYYGNIIDPEPYQK